MEHEAANKASEGSSVRNGPRTFNAVVGCIEIKNKTTSSNRG
jgi:hypothetical protein